MFEMALGTVLVPVNLRAKTRYCSQMMKMFLGTNELVGEDLSIIIRLDRPIS